MIIFDSSLDPRGSEETALRPVRLETSIPGSLVRSEQDEHDVGPHTRYNIEYKESVSLLASSQRSFIQGSDHASIRQIHHSHMWSYPHAKCNGRSQLRRHTLKRAWKP